MRPGPPGFVTGNVEDVPTAAAPPDEDHRFPFFLIFELRVPCFSFFLPLPDPPDIRHLRIR
jgi:hypothetical protein